MKRITIPEIPEAYSIKLWSDDAVADRMDYFDLTIRDPKIVEIYETMMEGRYDVVWWKHDDEGECFVLHKSSRHEGRLQLSIISVWDGEWCPSSHHTCRNAEDFVSEFHYYDAESPTVVHLEKIDDEDAVDFDMEKGMMVQKKKMIA